MNTSEVLNRAADLIEERGWTQGTSGWGFNQETPSALCLEGGIAAAMGDEDDLNSRACPAYRAVAEYLDWGRSSIYTWNDHDGRTATEVIEVLRACAVIEASREREAAEVSA